jgi:hypothetical protein
MRFFRKLFGFGKQEPPKAARPSDRLPPEKPLQPDKPPLKKWLTQLEAEIYTGMSTSWFAEQRKLGNLNPTKAGEGGKNARGLRYDISELDALLNSRRASPSRPAPPPPPRPAPPPPAHPVSFREQQRQKTLARTKTSQGEFRDRLRKAVNGARSPKKKTPERS